MKEETQNDTVTIVTHNGSFHVDELLAVATLLLYISDKPYKIVRTRDKDIIATADFVVDVGEMYDTKKNRFDHHQKGGADTRENGIPYSSFGLVWKAYGEIICQSQQVAQAIDKDLGYPVDMGDNGIDYYTRVREDVEPFILQSFVAMFRPTWRGEASQDERFMELLLIMKRMLQFIITIKCNQIDGAKFVEEVYQSSKDKRVIILDGAYPWHDTLATYSEPLYVVKPKNQGAPWAVECVRVDSRGFQNRKDLPLLWAGKFDQELQIVTGVSDAIFCHNKRYIAVTESKQSAVKLAFMALDA